MQRDGQVIQLSDHVKTKLKNYRYSPAPASLINASDALVETNDETGNFLNIFT